MTELFMSLTRKARIGSLVAIAVLGLVAATSAGAIPFLSAATGEAGSSHVLLPCSLTGVAVSSTGTPVSSSADCGPSAFGRGSGSATASIGKLGADARAVHFGSGTAAEMNSFDRYSDTVVFSGPGSDPVAVRMNLHFAGSLTASAGARAQAIVTAIVNGTFVGRNLVSVEDGVPLCEDIFPHLPFSGIGPCSSVYNATLQSSLILVPQDVPISFELDLDVDAIGAGSGSSATSLFADTFGFIVGGPVFDLPAGFTANSPTSFIVDNRFDPSPSPLPEPGSAALLLAGLAALRCVAQRRDLR